MRLIKKEFFKGMVFGILILVYLIIVLWYIVFGSSFILYKDNIRTYRDEENTDYLIYNGNVYFSCERNGTYYSIVSEANITQIGRVAKGFSSVPAYMIDEIQDEIIVSKEYPAGHLWLKSGYVLPKIFEAEISSIYYRQPNEDTHIRTEILLTQSTIFLDDVIDRQQYFTSHKGMEAAGQVYFYLSEIPGLQISMWAYELNTEIYLGYHHYIGIESKDYYYLVKNEYKELLSQML